MLLNLLSVRVIVNGTHIYALSREQPAVIILPRNHSRIVVSDGYHFTQPLEVGFYGEHTHHYKVACAIDDNILAAGALLLVLFYMVGLISGIFILKALSFLPILYFLYLYYINRKQFIRVKEVRGEL